MNRFDRAMAELMVLEGHQFTNDPNDAGGPTKFGISALGFPDVDIENLTYGQAKELYREHYWKPLMADHLRTYEVAFQLFEHAVHSDPPGRPRRAVRALQLSLISFGVIVTFDGIMGPQTLKAANEFAHQQCLTDAMNGFQFAQLVVGARSELEFYDMVFDRLPQLRLYLRGWLRRIEISSRV